MGCKFDGEDRIQEEFVDKIISGVCNETTQHFFLRKPSLKFDAVVRKVFSDEAAELGVEQFSFRDHNSKFSYINIRDTVKTFLPKPTGKNS